MKLTPSPLWIRPNRHCTTTSSIRLARSSTCRYWYYWRQSARRAGKPTPLWVTLSPPWPVLRLALKIVGKPAILGLLLVPLGLLANGDETFGEADLREHSDLWPDDHSQGLAQKPTAALP